MNLSAAWHRAARNRQRALSGMLGKVGRAERSRIDAERRAEAAEAEIRHLRATITTTDAQDDLEIALGRVELLERRVEQQRRTLAGLHQTLSSVRGLLRTAVVNRGHHATSCAHWSHGACDCYLRGAVSVANEGRRMGTPRARMP